MPNRTGRHDVADDDLDLGSDTDIETRFPPQVLRDYALIADGERGAIVGPRGDIAWMCAPHWHSDAVFATLAGGDGIYAITPSGRFVWGGYYEEGTLVWRSRWITDDGIIECREALALPGAADRAILLRQVVAVDCTAHVDIILDPRAGFGACGMRSVSADDQGNWTAQAGELHVRWSGSVHNAQVRHRGDTEALVARLAVLAGERADLVLEIAAQPFAAAPCDPARAWQATTDNWLAAVPPGNGLIAARDARQSQVVLRGLTSAGGGMVAAATTSLPERAEEGRNYDYRYAWIRDQCYAGQAAAAAGPYSLVDAATAFVSERLHADGPGLAPAYTVTGGRVPDQRRLGLRGYPGGFDLVGNWVNKQFQLDAFGESLLLLAAAARLDRLDTSRWEAAQIAAAAIGARWQEPDAGIWEIDNLPWTHSRLMCVAGLRSAAACGAWKGTAVAWSRLADTIVADTSAHALHPSGRWQRSPDDRRPDAALLMPPIRGALPPSDPRTTATLRACAAELTQDGYAYRFRQGDRPLGEAEGAFLLCGFILALGLHQQGYELEAARWFERNRAACGSPGLYSEEYDVTQRQLRGNLPQAFVHALMLECAARLSEPWSAGRADRVERA
jgi:GH15 family glucan-1,4-alpha-glucosidase